MQPQHHISVKEYFELDLRADGSPKRGGVTKYEYHAGEIYSMAGESLEHALIIDNVAQAVRSRISSEYCRMITSEMRVQVGDVYTYPDILIFCGTPDLTDTRPPSIKNPILVVEVLSESTRDRDKDWKLESYMEIRSLKEYWILEQRERRVLQYHRTIDQWGLRKLSGADEVLRSDHLDFKIPVAEFYLGLDL
jgi:Uma2 family endonuclease